jgi:hypothetical protein
MQLPDIPQHQSALPKSRVVEVIERSMDDTLRQLRAAGIPETEALAVIQRFSAFSVQILRELDHLYREFEELLAADPDRSQAHQEWLDTKAGGVLLTIEAFITTLVTEAINKAKEDYRTEVAKPREVITTVPAASRRPAWQRTLLFLARTPALWVLAVCAGPWFIVWTQVAGSPIWGVVAVGVTALVVSLLRWVGVLFIVIAAVVSLIFLA